MTVRGEEIEMSHVALVFECNTRDTDYAHGHVITQFGLVTEISRETHLSDRQKSNLHAVIRFPASIIEIISRKQRRLEVTVCVCDNEFAKSSK